MVGEACLASNAYYPLMPDYTLYSGVHVCWSEHSDLSFIYGFMSFDYALGTMSATTCNQTHSRELQHTCKVSVQNKLISTGSSLYQSVANAIFHTTKFPNIDLFATRLNHRLPIYMSPIPDKKALAINALSMDWNHIHADVCPPFHLI